MRKKGIYIARQFLLGLIALQILNLSVGSPDSQDNSYDYSCSYNNTYDPTESALEWIVELNYGQQPAFSYDVHENAAKSPARTVHWKTDLQSVLPELTFFSRPGRTWIELPVRLLLSPTRGIISPPPETSVD